MRDKKSIKTRILLLKIWKHLSKEKKVKFLLSLIISILSGLVELITISSIVPFLTVLLNPEKLLNQPISRFLSEFLQIPENHMVFPTIIFFGVSVALSAIVRLYSISLNFNLAAEIGAELSNKAYSNNLYQPYQFHIENNSSKLLTSTTIHINKTVGAISNFLQLISYTILTLAISLGIFLINGKLAIYLLFIFIIIYFLIAKNLNNEVEINSKKIARSEQYLVKTIQEGLGSIREIILSSNQEYYINIHKNYEKSKRILMARNQYISEFPRYTVEALALIFIAIISLFFVNEFDKSSSMLILLGGFPSNTKNAPSIQRIYLAWAILKSSSADLLSTYEMLKLKVEKRLVSKITPYKFKTSIKFDSVDFTYLNKKDLVIKNLNLEIYKGQKIGIIGKTGSGKSTLCDLLMGLIKPTSGHIYVDDKDIHYPKSSKNINKWQRSISNVPQFIF